MGARAGRREPERTCIACRRVRPKGDLVRIVRTAEGAVAVDHAGTMPGRGAYVCAGGGCTDRAMGKLGGALRVAGIDREQVSRGLSDVGVA